jgi:hypothetical protein
MQFRCGRKHVIGEYLHTEPAGRELKRNEYDSDMRCRMLCCPTLI